MDDVKKALQKARSAAAAAGKHASSRKASAEAVSQIDHALDLLYPPAPEEKVEVKPKTASGVSFQVKPRSMPDTLL